MFAKSLIVLTNYREMSMFKGLDPKLAYDTDWKLSKYLSPTGFSSVHRRLYAIFFLDFDNLMINSDSQRHGDDVDKEATPAKKFASKIWLRRLIFLLAGFVAFWIVADFVHSKIVAKNLETWEASINWHASGIRSGAEPYTIGDESADVAVLMIHGINETPYAYRKVAPNVTQQGLRCRAMLVAGFGKSFRRYKESTTDDWLQSVDDEIKVLKRSHKRVIIVAHSLGGAIAIQYVLQHPDAVDGLVLAAPAIDVSSARSPLVRVQTWHFLLNRTLIFSDVTQSPFGIDAIDELEKQNEMRMPFTPRKVIDQTFKLIEQNRDQEKELQIPVLMLLAEHDKVIDNEAAKSFFQKLPNPQARIVVFENSAHAILVDMDWKKVAAAIGSFAKQDLSVKSNAGE